ncbi:F390 synthetase-related protein [Paraburkholderia sp. ZP32-5]|uniref:F390 synthetase-related protein n=1 Tax=Paraburkholderia sp. ZP32-5 TaxID=2883245 RepID=UPI001F2679F2|nr:F390 synthetase-related protein [Paraburkholderia sp. ZP32-5]
MNFTDFAQMMGAFASTRYGLRFDDRASFERWQTRRLDAFLQTRLKQASFYRDYPCRELAALPIVDKAFTLQRFSAFNTRGIALETALAAARASEEAGVLPAQFDSDLTAGLSSGTSGRPGVFLANASERAKWAGIMLDRTLDRDLLRLLATRAKPLRVAFFLRANSSLYTTLRSRRIDFRFFDLQAGAHTHIDALAGFAPEVLVAPASVLGWLAVETLAGHLRLSPRKVISVAEVLEPDDETLIRDAWSKPVHQLYQCTEGFLGYTCSHGTLHLNEEFVHVEPEWIDDARTRFIPVITDFTRRTQLIVRYRLDDILRVRATPCPCGRVTMALDAIDGRLDDVLWLPSRHGGPLLPLFPDSVRRAVARCGAAVDDYSLVQYGRTLSLGVRGSETAFPSIQHALDDLIASQGMCSLPYRRAALDLRLPAAKRRRIVCATKPSADDEIPSFGRDHP